MASSGKRKTTMAKLSRESRLRERRVEKAARKVARKEAAARGETSEMLRDGLEQPDGQEAELSAGEPVVRTPDA
jgi:hypothetical protein